MKRIKFSLTNNYVESTALICPHYSARLSSNERDVVVTLQLNIASVGAYTSHTKSAFIYCSLSVSELGNGGY